MNKRFLFLAGILAAVVIMYGFIRVEEEPKAEINWVSFQEAVAAAELDNKKILIDIYTDWCGWCKRMDKSTYSDAEIVKYINKNYHSVKFDAEQKDPIYWRDHEFKYIPNGRRGYHELAARLLNNKLSYPTTVFLDANGSLLTRLEGYIEADPMIIYLHYLHEEAYNKGISIQDYERDFRNAQ